MNDVYDVATPFLTSLPMEQGNKFHYVNPLYNTITTPLNNKTKGVHYNFAIDSVVSICTRPRVHLMSNRVLPPRRCCEPRILTTIVVIWCAHKMKTIKTLGL